MSAGDKNSDLKKNAVETAEIITSSKMTKPLLGLVDAGETATVLVKDVVGATAALMTDGTACLVIVTKSGLFFAPDSGPNRARLLNIGIVVIDLTNWKRKTAKLKSDLKKRVGEAIEVHLLCDQAGNQIYLVSISHEQMAVEASENITALLTLAGAAYKVPSIKSLHPPGNKGPK